MTELENEFLQNLITAAWPLSLQVLFGLGLLLLYYSWSLFYYWVLDAAVRERLGKLLGVPLIWVLRHSASYPTSFELGFTSTRYFRWSWGIGLEDKRTFFKDGKVWFLSFLVVNIIGGLWPIALFLYVFLSLKALSYVVFLPTCIVVLILYSAFWSGRYEVKGMR